jgi:N-acetyl-gamma-glutamyl-phosphate reductase
MAQAEVKVGVVGGSGYTGIELLRLLLRHPMVSLHAVTSRHEAGQAVSARYGNLLGQVDLTFVEPDLATLSACDLVFFATPNGVAMRLVPDLLAAGVRVIDLAADFRLRDPAVWEQWYGMRHACPELLAEAVYGLPELYRSAIQQAQLVANPGCYPTAVSLALLPLVTQGVVDLQRVIADCKSGVSGAGRNADVNLLMGEVGESFKAYGVSGHRHLPEISQTLVAASGAEAQLTFVPHLVPMVRGIHATVYAPLSVAIEDLQAIFTEYYSDEPFVQVLPPGDHPETRCVRGANQCHIAVQQPHPAGPVVILSVIDNLVKGAAGQAVQNMNLILGLPEETGLQQVALLP